MESPDVASKPAAVPDRRKRKKARLQEKVKTSLSYDPSELAEQFARNNANEASRERAHIDSLLEENIKKDQEHRQERKQLTDELRESRARERQLMDDLATAKGDRADVEFGKAILADGAAIRKETRDFQRFVLEKGLPAIEGIGRFAKVALPLMLGDGKMSPDALASMMGPAVVDAAKMKGQVIDQSGNVAVLGDPPISLGILAAIITDESNGCIYEVLLDSLTTKGLNFSTQEREDAKAWLVALANQTRARKD